jgi:hypothetical protein
MSFPIEEEKIIGKFYDYVYKTRPNKELYLLIWKNGTKILANIDGWSDDDNGLDLDDPNYEDYTSFVIRVNKICSFNKSDGFPNYWFEEGKLTDFNYHNFPYEIYNSEGELISKREN